MFPPTEMWQKVCMYTVPLKHLETPQSLRKNKGDGPVFTNHSAAKAAKAPSHRRSHLPGSRQTPMATHPGHCHGTGPQNAWIPMLSQAFFEGKRSMKGKGLTMSDFIVT